MSMSINYMLGFAVEATNLENKTMQWLKEKGQIDKKMIYKTLQKTTDRTTRTTLKIARDLKYTGRLSSPYQACGISRAPAISIYFKD